MNPRLPKPMASRAPARMAAMVDKDKQSNGLRAARRTAAFVVNATSEAQRSKLPQMAAALAFRTIFGLIPAIVVGLVALRFFYTDEDISGVLHRAMEYSGISAIAVDQEQMGPFPEWDPRSVPQPEPEAPPQTSGSLRLDEWIEDLIARLSDVNLRAISAIGIVFVIYAAIAMLVEIERAFNQIYRVPIGRSWVRRIVQYWSLLTLGTIGLAATFYVGQQFTDWLGDTAALGGEDGKKTLAIAAVGYLTTVSISTALLLLMYTAVPNTKVRLWPALAGAFLAALTWEAGKWGFTQYLNYSAFYARIYGSIALIPLFLLWVYVTWVIVLAGLQSAYYLQHGRYSTVPQPTEALPTGVVDPAAALVVMGALSKRFEAGKPAGATEIAKLAGIPQGVSRQMLAALAETGHVLRITKDDEEEPAYTLARPAEKIPAEEVLKIGEALASPGTGPLSPIAERMRDSRLELVRGKSVAAILGLPQTPSDPSPEAGTAPLGAIAGDGTRHGTSPERAASEPSPSGRVDLA